MISSRMSTVNNIVCQLPSALKILLQEQNITRVGLDFVTIQNRILKLVAQQNRVTPSPFDLELWTLDLDLDCDNYF